MFTLDRPVMESPRPSDPGRLAAQIHPRRRSVWRSAVVALALIGLLGLVVALAGLRILHRPVAEIAASPSLLTQDLRPQPQTETMTLGGMDQALAVLQRDLRAWQRLVTPDGGFDLVALRTSMENLRPARSAAFAQAAPPAAVADREVGAPEAAMARPETLALLVLAITLAAMTLLAGLAAMLAERLLLAPFRALRLAAMAISEGQLNQPVPGIERQDEAGDLARSLERFRIAALARQMEEQAGLDVAGLPGAGSAIEAASRQIQRVASEATSLALECVLVANDHAIAEPGCRSVAQGVQALSDQVAVIREASRGASMAVWQIAESIGSLEESMRVAPVSGQLRRPRLAARSESLAEAG